ncbi:hypothetical protein SAMN05444722_2027 [Rhodovulum sp. ES.010]|uniref:hypothetical protein n=1 Tax=Rhodovulum sp. ES.010 TaxID=1882821 RepID=UPI00092C03D4|nr:hypothetical protein [Rhodovulum sp. ES.010]SIO42038.1 hypothetical protein SAMN05444722_2027 [Rhodovulum sp. ES.010]
MAKVLVLRVTISSLGPGDSEAGWDGYLSPTETLLWTGRPQYGRRIRDVVGAEKTWHIGLLAGAVAMWLTWPMIGDDAGVTATDALWVYGAVTLLFGLVSAYIVVTRAYVLGTLHYAVTDRRALVRREGRNHFLARRAFLVSSPLSPEFSCPVVEDRPYPSLTVGHLLSEGVVQPLGYGLVHPGWGPLRTLGVIPVLFEQVEDVDHVRRLLVESAAGAA